MSADTILAAVPTGVWLRQARDTWEDNKTGLAYLSNSRADIFGATFPSTYADILDEDLWTTGVSGGRPLVYQMSKNPAESLRRWDLPGMTPTAIEVMPDGTVWVGGFIGIWRYDPATGDWTSFENVARRREAINGIASGPNGDVWLLRASLKRGDASWGASIRHTDGSWWHVNLRNLTGLDVPYVRDAIAVDGHGRLWFTAVDHSVYGCWLGVLNRDGTLAHGPNMIGRGVSGRASLRAGLRTNLHGVASDGRGGILLYNGPDEPLRHWRP